MLLSDPPLPRKPPYIDVHVSACLCDTRAFLDASKAIFVRFSLKAGHWNGAGLLPAKLRKLRKLMGAGVFALQPFQS